MVRGELFIISGPSGTGKTTLIRHLFKSGLAEDGHLVFSISHTTRPPRKGEVEAKDYYFVDRETFEEMIDRNQFLEWATVHRHFKGTSRQEVFPRLEQGIDVVLDIDVQGAEQVLESHPEACSIFILPPSYQELKRRLQERRLDEPDQVAARLSVSLREIECYGRYEYAIINDDAERAGRALAGVVSSKRHRMDRMRGLVESIVRDFQQASR